MRRPHHALADHRGFTLVEVLVASALTLMIMASLAGIFAFVSTSVAESRATIEMSDRLRACKHRLQRDLELLTAPTIPPLAPEAENGYLEIIEGPIGPIFTPDQLDLPANQNRVEFDDVDDVIMFTARASANEPFVGRWSGSNTERSSLAEIAWFLRGTTLYRRVLLIIPQATNPWDFNYNRTGTATPSASYNYFDLSMRQQGGWSDRRKQPPAGVQNEFARCVPNSLGDLTKRENRYAHQPLVWPYESRMWGQLANSSMPGGAMPGLGLPTLAECCHRLWPWPIYEPNSSYPGSSTMMEPVKVGSDDRNALIIPRLTATTAANGGSSFGEGLNLTANGRYDPLGTNPNPFTSANPIRYPNTRPVTQIDGLNRLNNFQGGRYDDIIMTDVMSFDVKVWDPGAPIFEIGPGGPNSVPIGPGDWGYIDALKQFSLSGQNSALRVVSFGAYVDLNYMQPTGSDPYDPAILRPLPNQPPRPYPAQIGYEAALFKMESSQRLPRGTLPRPKFSGAGDSGCLLSGLPAARGAIQFDKAPLNYAGFRACIYDTWSTSYERDGIDNDKDGQIDEGTDGMDNHPYLHGIDDPSEIDAPPPYPWSLRGVQIKIRAFEPNTKQIREVTVVTEFLPE